MFRDPLSDGDALQPLDSLDGGDGQDLASLGVREGDTIVLQKRIST